MPLLPTLGRTLGTGVKALRILVRGGIAGSAWATRRVGTARARGAANEAGMIRLFDLHALSCAGDTLIAIGLAGTIFFNVPLGEARSKVALYLLVTMVPFALLAPVAGPLLDHFRHGRRYALAVTMLGRAFLAYVIANNLLGWGLYPAAFGVLALSRAYGVARSAAVPRLLPEGVGLSQVGARASVYGTFAGALVAPIGLLAFEFGPQWPLRVSSLIFLVGVVIALRLPPRADSDPPEAVPRPFRAMLRLHRGPDRPLSGPLVINTLIGSASFRLLYGFLLLYLAFAVKASSLSTLFFGTDIGGQGAVALVGAALATGTFLATAVGTRLRIRRPTALQSTGLTITAAVSILTAIFYSLPMVALLSLTAATFSGIAKLAVDASIQERVPERLRASAFAHSETALMVAWVAGGALGLIPLPDRLGILLATTLTVAAAAHATWVATRHPRERLHGRPDADLPPDPFLPTDPPPTTPDNRGRGGANQGGGPGWGSTGQSGADQSGADQSGAGQGSTGQGGAGQGSTGWGSTGQGNAGQGNAGQGNASRGSAGKGSMDPGGTGQDRATGGWAPRQPGPGDDRTGTPAAQRPAGGGAASSAGADERSPDVATPPAERRKRGFFSRSAAKKAAADEARGGSRGTDPGEAASADPSTRPGDRATRPEEPSGEDRAAPPGFHIYRPTSAAGDDRPDTDEESS